MSVSVKARGVSFADLIFRRPMWEQLSQDLQLTLHEGAAAVAIYDNVAELMHGEGARFPRDAQLQGEQTAERMKALIASAGQRSRVLGALVSVLVPTGLAISGEWGTSHKVVIVPDHLKASVHPDSRLIFAAFQEKSLGLGLDLVPEGPMFQAARQFTRAQDIETGLVDLDERAIIRGSDEAEIRRRLRRPEVHQAVMALLNQEGRCQINDRGALLMVSVATARGGRGRLLLDSLVHTVQILGQAS